MELNKPIALVGMMGAGKTSFGKKIAKKINAQFFDSDAHIKLRTGYTPKEIFNYFGESMLKETEFIIIQELAQNSNAIISTGDSLIDNKKAWEFLRQNAITIWLNIDLKLISARLRPNEDRPYLDSKKDESIFKFLTQLYKKRAQKYRQAHLIIHKPILHKKTFLKKLQQILEKLQTTENLNINIELEDIAQMDNSTFPILNYETNTIELPKESLNKELVEPKLFKKNETQTSMQETYKKEFSHPKKPFFKKRNFQNKSEKLDNENSNTSENLQNNQHRKNNLKFDSNGNQVKNFNNPRKYFDNRKKTVAYNSGANSAPVSNNLTDTFTQNQNQTQNQNSTFTSNENTKTFVKRPFNKRRIKPHFAKKPKISNETNPANS